MELDMLLGRFHPLIIHLPIGIFFIAYFLNIYYWFISGLSAEIRRLLSIVYALSGLTAVFACVTGFLISKELKYDPGMQNLHQWLAVATTIILCINAYVSQRYSETGGLKNLILPTLVVVFLSITGHFGGELTHGKDHLSEYAPESLHWFLGKSNKLNISPSKNPDSVLVYDDFVKPILEVNCTACHNRETRYGGFSTERYSDLFVENKGLIPILKRNSVGSELFSRITMSKENEKFMPPNGLGLSYYEVKIIKYWIDNGADSLTIFDNKTMDVDLSSYLYKEYALDFSELPYYEKNIPDSLDQQVFDKLDSIGIAAKYLGAYNYYLDVKIQTDSINEQHLGLLEELKNHITFLDLSQSNLSDEELKIVGRLPHLTRLDLHDNPITSNGVTYLASLENLISVNLYKTKLDKNGISNLLDRSSVEKIYLWETLVSVEEIEKLRENYPSKKIFGGFSFDISLIPSTEEEAN